MKSSYLLTPKEANRIANEVVGSYCQSSILTMISDCGQKKVFEPPQRISGYELIPKLDGVELLLIVGGVSCMYDTCFNFSDNV